MFHFCLDVSFFFLLDRLRHRFFLEFIFSRDTRDDASVLARATQSSYVENNRNRSTGRESVGDTLL